MVVRYLKLTKHNPRRFRVNMKYLRRSRDIYRIYRCYGVHGGYRIVLRRKCGERSVKMEESAFARLLMNSSIKMGRSRKEAIMF